jgi:predicted permease
MDTLVQDLRYALRALRRSPGFTLVAALTLALGIGANAAVYSVAGGILWRALPAREPGRLAVIFGLPSGGGYADFSFADYREFRAGAYDVFEDVIAYYPVSLALSDEGKNERVWGEMVSGNYFDALGLPAALGRTFLPGEAEPGAAPVAVLSDAGWRSYFAADRGVVGRTIRLGGQPFTVVGVAPRGFTGAYYVGFQPALFVPAGTYDLVLPGTPGALDQHGATSFRMMGRLKPGVSVDRARAAVATIAARLGRDFPATNAGVGATALRELDARPEPEAARGFGFAAGAFLGGIGLVQLVACANVANLLLARATARRREVAVRIALGATRGRLVRQLLVESALLAAAGLGLGLLLAEWLTGLLGSSLTLPTDIPFVFDFSLDAHAVGYTAGVAVLTALAFGLVPAWRASDPAVAPALKDGAPALAGRGRLRSALVVGQVAVTCVLLVGALLAVRTLRAVGDVAPGFASSGRLLASVSPQLQHYDQPRGQVFYRALLERVRALPGVRGAALADYVPLEFAAHGGSLFVEGRENRPAGDPTFWNFVSPGYFDAIGTRLAGGRDFGPGDTTGAPGVVVISRALAEREWPGRLAIGRRLRIGTADAPPLTVVGVAEDVKVRQLTETPRPYLYLPLAQQYSPQATVVVHTAGDPLGLAPLLRRTVAELDAEMPLADLKTADALLAGRALVAPRIGAWFATSFGLLALALAVVGLYGVVSYTVTQRVREIGIRMALGADAARIARRVVADGLRLAGLGLAIGVPAAVALARLVRSLLFGVAPTDPTTYAVIVALLALVAAAASWLPARRAAAVDPMLALRNE